METIGASVAGYIHDISRGDYTVACQLVDLVLERSAAAVNTKGILRLHRSVVKEMIEYKTRVEETRLRSIVGFLTDRKKKKDLKQYIDKAVKTLKAFSKARIEMIPKGNPWGAWKELISPASGLRKKAEQMYPKKKTIGTYTYQNIPLSERKGIIGGSAWGYQDAAPSFWADGTRSVYEIWRNICCEFNQPYKLGKVIKLFEFLKQHNFVDM
jgi:hypothetical protein